MIENYPDETDDRPLLRRSLSCFPASASPRTTDLDAHLDHSDRNIIEKSLSDVYDADRSIP